MLRPRPSAAPRPALTLRNRQQARPVDLRLLRRIALRLLAQHFRPATYELGVFLVGAREMARINERFLRHAGSTDVITLDYGDAGQPENLCGDIFICVDEAVVQARRFRTTWESEVVRYLAHALLHLQGFDDRKPADYRRMKQAENRLLKQIGKEFSFGLLGARRPAGRLNPTPHDRTHHRADSAHPSADGNQPHRPLADAGFRPDRHRRQRRSPAQVAFSRQAGPVLFGRVRVPAQPAFRAA